MARQDYIVLCRALCVCRVVSEYVRLCRAM